MQNPETKNALTMFKKITLNSLYRTGCIRTAFLEDWKNRGLDPDEDLIPWIGTPDPSAKALMLIRRLRWRGILANPELRSALIESLAKQLGWILPESLRDFQSGSVTARFLLGYTGRTPVYDPTQPYLKQRTWFVHLKQWVEQGCPGLSHPLYLNAFKLRQREALLLMSEYLERGIRKEALSSCSEEGQAVAERLFHSFCQLDQIDQLPVKYKRMSVHEAITLFRPLDPALPDTPKNRLDRVVNSFKIKLDEFLNNGNLASYQIKVDFPFLESSEIKWCLDFKAREGHLPMFFLLKKSMERSSKPFVRQAAQQLGFESEGGLSLPITGVDQQFQANKTLKPEKRNRLVSPTIRQYPDWSAYPFMNTCYGDTTSDAILDEIRKESVQLTALQLAFYYQVIRDMIIVSFKRSSFVVCAEIAHFPDRQPLLRRLEKLAKNTSDCVGEIDAILQEYGMTPYGEFFRYFYRRYHLPPRGMRCDGSSFDHSNLPGQLVQIVKQSPCGLKIHQIRILYARTYGHALQLKDRDLKELLRTTSGIYSVGVTGRYQYHEGRVGSTQLAISVQSIAKELIRAAGEPVSIQAIWKAVNEHYTTMEYRRVKPNLHIRSTGELILYEGDLVGLRSMAQETQLKRAKPYREIKDQLGNLKRFVESHHRFPFSGRTALTKEERNLATWVVRIGKTQLSHNATLKNNFNQFQKACLEKGIPVTYEQHKCMVRCQAIRDVIRKLGRFSCKESNELRRWIEYRIHQFSELEPFQQQMIRNLIEEVGASHFPSWQPDQE